MMILKSETRALLTQSQGDEDINITVHNLTRLLLLQ